MTAIDTQTSLFTPTAGRVLVRPAPTILAAMVWGHDSMRLLLALESGQVLSLKWSSMSDPLPWHAIAAAAQALTRPVEPFSWSLYLGGFSGFDAFMRDAGYDSWNSQHRELCQHALEGALDELLASLVAATRAIAPSIATRLELVVAAAGSTEAARALAPLMLVPLPRHASWTDPVACAWRTWPRPLLHIAGMETPRARRLRAALAAGASLAEAFVCGSCTAKNASAALRFLMSPAISPWVGELTHRDFERWLLALAQSPKLRDAFPRRDLTAIQRLRPAIESAVQSMRRAVLRRWWPQAIEWILQRGLAGVSERVDQLSWLRGQLLLHGPPGRRAGRALLTRVFADRSDAVLEGILQLLACARSEADPVRVDHANRMLAALPAAAVLEDEQFQARWLRGTGEITAHARPLGQCIVDPAVAIHQYVAWSAAFLALTTAAGAPAATVAIAFDVQRLPGTRRAYCAQLGVIEEQGADPAVAWFRRRVLPRLHDTADDEGMQAFLHQRALEDARQTRRARSVRRELSAMAASSNATTSRA